MNVLQTILIFASIVTMQLFFGGGDGTRFIYALPAYLLLGVSGVLTLLSVRKASARMDRWCLLSTLLLAAYFFTRIALSPWAWIATVDFYMLLAALLVYFITALAVRSIGARFAIAICLVVLGVAQSGIGIWQFARDPNFNPLVSNGRGDASMRASGLFISGNHLAGFLEVALPLAVSLCFWGGFKARGKIFTGYLALVCLTGLVLTGSRGGYLSVCVGLLVFACLSIWTLRWRLAASLLPRVLTVTVAVALLGGTLAFVAQRSFPIRMRTNTVFATADVRLQLWEAAWKQFQLAPVFGTGSRTYLYYGRTFRDPHVQTDPIFAHNDWLQTLAEYGIAGVLLVIGFAAAHLHCGWQRWGRMVERFSMEMSGPDESRALALHIGTISAIAAVLVHEAMDFNLHIPANLLVTSLLFGLLATRRTRHEEKPTLPARALHAVPAMLGAWMLVVAVPRTPGDWFVEKTRGYFAVEKYSEALKAADQAKNRGVRNPEFFFQLGEWRRYVSSHARLSQRQKRAALEAALGYYGEAVAICPQDVGYTLRKAWTLGLLGRFDEAEPLLARAKELDPNSPRVWVCSAMHWKRHEKPDEALADFHKMATFGYGWIPTILAEFDEKMDPQELETIIKTGPPEKPQ